MRSLEDLARSRLRNLIHSGDEEDSTWGWKWKSVLSRIVANLKTSVERVHIRLEDNETIRSEPFSMGMYLHSVVVAPSSTSSSKYLCQSVLQVSNAAIYVITTDSNKVKRHVTHDNKRSSMRLHIKSTFKDALQGSVDCKSTSTMRFFMRKVFLVESQPSYSGLFIVKPSDGIARLNILEPSQKTSSDEPIVSVSIETKPLSVRCLFRPSLQLTTHTPTPTQVHIDKSQYLALASFVNNVSNFQNSARYRSSRPTKKEKKRKWWQWAISSTIKMRNRDVANRNKKLWKSTREYQECLTEWRVRYMLLYVRKLNGETNLKQLDEMNRALEFHIIREFQTQAEKIWAEQRERKEKQSWLSYLWNAEDEKNSTRAMIQEMEQLASEPSFEPHKIEGTEARDDDVLMRVDVELSSVKLHVHFLTSSVMNISFEKLQTLLTYRRKYV